MTCDPRSLGAKCDECPLREISQPVPTEQNNGSQFVVVGDYPGENEEREGRPFVGPNGSMMQSTFGSLGLKRRDANWTNVVLCRPPESDMNRFLEKLRKRNREIVKENIVRTSQHVPPLPLVPTPMECCAPRLWNEVMEFDKVLAVGGLATKVVFNSTISVMAVRGSPTELDRFGKTLKVVPTLHPSFVAKNMRWMHVMKNDILRAVKWWNGVADWSPPVIYYHPRAEDLRAFLADPSVPYWTYDVETDGIESLTCGLRCVGIGTPEKVVIVGYDGIQSGRPFYQPHEQARVHEVLKEFFADPNRLKVGHNCLYTGTPVILGDGSSVPIEKLVRSKYGGEVLALNSKGRIVSARVTNWFRERVEHQKWLVIRRVGEKKHARGLTVTPDHEIYTTRGRVPAEQLRTGDFILTGETEYEPEERQAILGTLLGDSTALAHSSRRENGKTVGFAVDVEEALAVSLRGGHASEALTHDKTQWLRGLDVAVERSGSGFNPDGVMYTYRTSANRQVAELARLVYQDGKRRLRPEVLDLLGPVGLAWLYADDGFKHTRDERRQEAMLIATCGFSREDIESSKEWFSVNFGTTTITGNGSLRIGVEGSQKFAAYIAPYLLPSARYKLPKGNWPEFVGFPRRETKPYAIPIESINPYIPPRGDSRLNLIADTRWCLQTTEGNFLTGFGFVKNCGSYDRIVIEQHFGVTPNPIMDTIMLHRLVESELPHNLGFLGSMYTGAPSWKCYDGETEVLTPDGWVRFDTLQRSVEVAQWDNGAVSFVQPVAYVDQPYTGKVWKLTNQAVDLVVTPDHKMIYRQKGTDRLKICAVQDLPASAGSLPHTGVKYDEDAECDPAFVRLLAATQADGSWVERADGWAVDFGFTKERKIERLTDILTRLNVPYTVKETGTKNRRTRIWVGACAVTENLYALLGPNKIFPASLLDLPMTLRSAFLDELPLWDGTATDTHTNYNTVEKANADMVQAVAAITGRTTRLALYANGEHRPVYRVSLPSGAVRDRSWSKLEGLNREQVDFDDRIYCVSVPSGFILVRRNGKVTVSGNTDREGRKLAYGSETDHELHEYCGLDVAVTAAVVPPLYEQVRLRDQMRLVSGDHRIQAVCAEMHRIGMFVDQGDRGVREKTLVQEAFSHREALCKLVEMPKLNPGSPHQLRELLFEKWKIEPPVDDELRYTLSGDPSTSDNVLRSCLSIPGLTELQLNAIRHIRYYRKAQKLLGTYVAKLRFNTDLAEAGWDEEEEYEERETRKQYGEEKKGIVDPRTGRMYPGYNAHVAVTGRLSSSKPINAQNFPSKLRSMVTAAPGHILVGADADQLELRIAASLWKSELYLAALAAGADPHASTALAVFGDKFRACNGFPGGEWKGDLFIPNGTGKWASDAKRLRDLAKRVQYASQYAASVETVHRVIAQTETNNEKPTEAYPWPTVLPYLDISVREVRMMHEKWVENAKFDGGWDMEMETYRTYGFLAEPILGRRRDFLDGENLNEIVNFRIQSSGASLMNKALLQIHEQIPLHKWGPHTGIINQCHDSIVVECPLDGAVYVPEKKKWEAPKGSIAWNVKHIIEEAMNQTTPALPGVAITATAEIGMRWNEV
jgi:DNA polymerase I-like protein with 3'-5' exonuclease and polymerase domains/uracil-DNA glycosylase